MTHKKFSLLSILLLHLIFISTIAGQTGIIKGHILDGHTKEPLFGASVQLLGTVNGAISDEDGSFLITGIPIGKHSLKTTYFSYKQHEIKDIDVRQGDTTFLELSLEPTAEELQEVQVVAKANRETEQTLLLDRRNSLISTQHIGAQELSGKGLGDAGAAVATMTGVSKQEGVKNVFVRGLGDRYNVTLLNGFQVPSEDPEYKNIALDFFESDVIKNISVDKVFRIESVSDVGGAVVDIRSKESSETELINIEVSGKLNTNVADKTILYPDGTDYFGFSKINDSGKGNFQFKNKLDPRAARIPLAGNYKISAGNRWTLNGNPFSLFAVAAHSSDIEYTEEIIRNMTTDGTVYQNQTGKKHASTQRQLILANAMYETDKSTSIAYNLMLIHATNQYFGEYSGRHSEIFQGAWDETGYLRRQQINDNRLMVHQLLGEWRLAEKWRLHAGVSFNNIKSAEPDRRENYLGLNQDGSYSIIGGNRQKRFFSNLNGNDFNTRVLFDYHFNKNISDNQSKISFGYSNQSGQSQFESKEYNFTSIPTKLWPDKLWLDKLYNAENYENNKFYMTEGFPGSYQVTKYCHSVFATASVKISGKLSGEFGYKYDLVNTGVEYDVPGRQGKDSIHKGYSLPGIGLKYDVDGNNSLRLGASKTYTLPQPKEISPYQYVNISFTSEGNAKLKPSDNYNIELKWDNYLSPSELISVSVFYKKIMNPIGRVDKGNSAGLLTYDNIAQSADVFGLEFELRKRIIEFNHNETRTYNKLTAGFNASWLVSQAKLNLLNTSVRNTMLEGASPFIVNADLSYKYSKDHKSVTASLVFNYVHDRIYTIGTIGRHDIMQKSMPMLDFVVIANITKQIGLKLKAGNLLDPGHKLTRTSNTSSDEITLSQYRKGRDFSLGLSIRL